MRLWFDARIDWVIDGLVDNWGHGLMIHSINNIHISKYYTV